MVVDRRQVVLVVDDSETTRMLIALHLALEGYDVVEACDGQDCLDAVVSCKPDLITLDVAMPRLDGLSTLERLRADPDTAATPIVLVTACPGHTEPRWGAVPGVDAYVTKPFEPARLMEVVRSLVAQRQRAGAPRPDTIGR